jgi:hypothetical protein
VTQSLNIILLSESERRTGITFTITIERHHITGGSDPPLLLLFTTCSSTSIRNLGRQRVALITVGSLVLGILSISCQVIPGSCDDVASPHHARHGGIVDDGRVLVVEGAETEDLLEELPGADQVTNTDGDGGFTDVPELISRCQG